MEVEEDLSTLTNELFRRVGRNLLNFQRIEGLLKFLVGNGLLQGPFRELSSLQAKNVATVHRSTMGILAGRLVDEFLSDAGDLEDVAPEPTEAWFSFRITFESDANASAELRDGLKALVEERNDLVHHLNSRWDSSSVDNTRGLLKQLDEQRERLRPIHERLQAMVRSISDGMKDYEAFLASPEGRQMIDLLWLQQSPLVLLLGECATQLAREDGWVPLTTAGQVLRKQAPEHVDALKERYGYSTLKQLLLATGMFDILDEPTLRGFRTVYRWKAEVAA